MWAGLILGTAWFLRQTQGAAILELYSLLVSPLQEDPSHSLVNQLTNKRIEELLARTQELEQQNRHLKALLGYVETEKQPLVNAPVIGRSADDWWQQVILGRGSQNGITKDSTVTGVGGLVGRVVSVTPHTSSVLLISNPDSRVGATISRTRSMGVIKGQGSQVALMQFFEKVPEVRPGDIVTTSPVSRLFPGGIPIGKVQSVNLESNPAPQAKIILTAPINDLEWVSVHPSSLPEKE
jgi:rod shape-determining protein MreC